MNIVSNKQSHQHEEIDLTVVFHQIWLNKWIILAILTFFLVLGVFYTSKQVPQYRVNALLQIDSKQPGVGPSGSIASQLFVGGVSSDAAPTQIALIRSRFILEPVIRSLGLDIYVQPQLTWWQRIFSSSTINHQLTVASLHVPHSLINKRLTLIVDKLNHVQLYDEAKQMLLQGPTAVQLSSSNGRIQLKIKSIKAPVGSWFTLVKQSDVKVIKSVSDALNIEESGAKIHQNTGILDISLSGDKPQSIVNTLNAIVNMTKLKDADKKAQEAAQTLAFLYKQLPVTKNLLENAERDLNRYRAKSGKIDIKLQTQFLLSRMADLARQQAELQIKKIEMLQQYTDIHPLIIALNAQIKALQTQQNKMQLELRKLPASDQVALNLMRDVKVKQALYMVLLKKIQELQVVKAGTISGVRILSYAQLPDAPLPAKRVVVWVSSLLCGFMFSFVVIFGRKLFSPRVEDPHWSERHFNIPNLATVPYSKEQADSSNTGLHNQPNKKLPLLAYVNPRNLAIESLRSLRTSLQVSLACSSNNIISILGACPGVGKSFVSVNLAYLLAAGGKRVLIIDGDLRRGSMHKYFSAAPAPGLAEILSQDLPIEKALKVSTFHQNLTFLPRGAYPKDPSELLMSEQFRELLQVFSRAYDVVVIDTAPVLLVTDAVLIGSHSSINYLIVGAGVHHPGEIELVIKRLSAAGVELHGTIFNFHRSASKSHYYGKYYQHTYYDEHKSKA